MSHLAHIARHPTSWLLSFLLILAGCSDQLPTEPQITERLSAPTLNANLQATPPGYIRIGVVPSETSITIGGTGDFVVIAKASGDQLLTGSNESIEVSLGGSAVATTNYRLQVSCTSAAGRDDLIARATAEGYETYAEDAGPCWRVMIGKFAPDAAWSLRNNFRNEVIAKGLAGSDSFWKHVTVVEGATEYKVTYSGGTLTSEEPIVLKPVTGMVRIEGSTYRGIAEVALNASSALAGINELPLEEYLYGVVPRELPPVPYGLLEAQKAQAVAARTYALANMGKRKADGYDLLPTTSDQVYGGYEDEHPVSTAAVNGTAGVVAVYEGDLITALYHSTSGGFTANSEAVYTATVPYLRGVPDAQRGKSLEHVPMEKVFKRAANPKSLRAEKNGDFEADWSRYHRWYVYWTADEIAAVVANSFNAPVTEVYEINVVDRAALGRVQEIHFVTDAGTFVEHKDRIRTALKYYNASGSQVSLRSTLFYIEPMTDSTGAVGFQAWGGGWGHGVGMSQTGAVGMAEKGATYEEILKHYYRDIELETR
ncbi:MAG TPA: SpoIID/LytB domain-containing protein [Longimicrobiaceae bacterium]|nr:SpoIID/LytB domain-containing protein [Longimicrobiaceae bacterium]